MAGKTLAQVEIEFGPNFACLRLQRPLCPPVALVDVFLQEVRRVWNDGEEAAKHYL
jgi:hypothetical protein